MPQLGPIWWNICVVVILMAYFTVVVGYGLVLVNSVCFYKEYTNSSIDLLEKW